MTEDKRDRNTPEGAGMPEEEFSRLMGSISAMAPLLKGVFSPVDRRILFHILPLLETEILKLGI